MVTKDVKRINEWRFSKTECYKVGNKPLFLLGLVSLAEPVETLWFGKSAGFPLKFRGGNRGGGFYPKSA